MSFGSNKSRTQQTQDAWGMGEQWNSSRDFSQSNQFQQDFGTNVWGGQAPHLQHMFGEAQNAFQNFDPNQAMQTMGTAERALTGMLNPGMDPAMEAYSRNIGQQFQEQILPGLQSNAIQTGGLGGSRHQIGAALAGQRAMQSIGDFAAQSYAGQQQRALDAANQLGGIADFQRQMPFYALSQYAGLLGGPTMQSLGGFGTGSSMGMGASDSYGYNANQSTGQATSRSSQFNFGSPSSWFGGK